MSTTIQNAINSLKKLDSDISGNPVYKEVKLSSAIEALEDAKKIAKEAEKNREYITSNYYSY